ncbi:WD repeat-containing protein 60 [Homalodisca vitripennis]|nr:WD repeat-containing protein 60 [Homalodisca vitripennis]
MCLWDLREQSIIHCRCFLKQPDWLLRSPTYISANLERDKRHLSPVISIKILPESNSDDSAKTTTEQTPTQIVSLDEDGLLVVWTIVETRSSTNVDSGLAPWGRVRLVQSSHLRVLKAFPRSIERAIQCRCLSVDSMKPSNLYVGTNSGQVLHCLQTSVRARPQFYTANIETNTSITCMEFSRCGHPLFMIGDTTGRVQIYRTMTERPLVDVSASAVSPGPPVKGLQWSSAQPGLFFVLDANSCIHVWDLCKSDMCPQMSVPFSGQTLTSICLTPHSASKMMAIASEAGTVDIYSLKAEFGALPKKESERLQDVFSRYITIL